MKSMIIWKMARYIKGSYANYFRNFFFRIFLSAFNCFSDFLFFDRASLLNMSTELDFHVNHATLAEGKL